MERRQVCCLLEARAPKRRRSSDIETVHSGQFMKTKVHDATTGDEDDAHVLGEPESPAPVIARRRSLELMELLAGDGLGVLVERVSATYCTRFTSPKWVDYKGIGLPWHDKVRMNNLIWREWHLQFTSRRAASYCPFAVALDDPVYLRPLAVVLEGKYWKRKLDAVTAEYQRRRVFWRERRGWERAASVASQVDSLGDKMWEASSTSTITSPVWVTPNSDTSPYSDIQDDAFIAELLQGSCLDAAASQRWKPDQQLMNWDPKSTTEQDSLAVTLIEEFLRNEEMDWRSDDVACVPQLSSTLSFEDAIGILTEATCEQESEQPCTSASCSMPAACAGQPQVGGRACAPQQCRRVQNDWYNMDTSSQEETFLEAPPLFFGPPQSAIPSPPPPPPPKVNLKRPPPDHRVVASGSDFDVLRRIVPSLSDGSRKHTKVTILERSAEHCRELKEENSQLDEELAQLRMQINVLRHNALAVQNSIPNEEALRENRRQDMFQTWVHARSSHNCKFCLFALLMAPLYPSFMASVSMASEDELHRTLSEWLRKSCTLASFRQSVLSSLTLLCKSTSVLATPERLPEELLSKTKNNWFLDPGSVTH